MKIAIVDGQGGGLGKVITEKLKGQFKDRNVELIALGTNSLATTNMMKAGAHCGATGENAIKVMSKRVDVIIGPLAILMANSMMGEITPIMAEAIADSTALKMILPLNRCGIYVAGTKEVNLKDIIEDLMVELDKIVSEK